MLYNRYDPGYQGRRGWVFWSWRGNMEMINTIIDDRVKNICVGEKKFKKFNNKVRKRSGDLESYVLSQLN